MYKVVLYLNNSNNNILLQLKPIIITKPDGVFVYSVDLILTSSLYNVCDVCFIVYFIVYGSFVL